MFTRRLDYCKTSAQERTTGVMQKPRLQNNRERGVSETAKKCDRGWAATVRARKRPRARVRRVQVGAVSQLLRVYFIMNVNEYIRQNEPRD